MLRSERKGVLESVLLKLGENRVYFLQLFFRKIKNIRKQSDKHLLYFVDSRHSRHNNTPSGANKGRAKKHRYDINKNTIRDNVQNPTR